MTQLTDHFSLEELTASSTACRLCIDNTPHDIQILANLQLAAEGLELVRALLGKPMHIDSGYRCETLNRAVNGAVASDHLLGYAADFVCPDFGTPLEIVTCIVSSDIKFDQCIQEGTWVHISFNPRMRQEVLTAHFGAGGTTYTQGA